MDPDYSTVMVPKLTSLEAGAASDRRGIHQLRTACSIKQLSEQKDLQLSSASIQTVMAELEEQGY